MKAASCVLFLASLLAPESGSGIDTRVVWVGPSPEARRLLQIAEDKGQSCKDRLRALDQLVRRREAATVPRLLRFLPGESDVVTLRVVIALGEIGDRSALPGLLKVRDDPNRRWKGKINAALEDTIARLEKRRD
jgi:HEAT repeat protein